MSKDENPQKVVSKGILVALMLASMVIVHSTVVSAHNRVMLTLNLRPGDDTATAAAATATANAQATATAAAATATANAQATATALAKLATASSSPSAGPVGTTLDIKGSSFPSSVQSVTIGYNTGGNANCQNAPNQFGPVAVSGSFETWKPWPATATQTFTVCVTALNATIAIPAGNFRVVSASAPSASVDKSSYKVGSTITVSGRNFTLGGSLTVDVTIQASDGSSSTDLGGVTTDSSGNFDQDFKVPKHPTGDDVIVISYGGDSSHPILQATSGNFTVKASSSSSSPTPAPTQPSNNNNTGFGPTTIPTPTTAPTPTAVPTDTPTAVPTDTPTAVPTVAPAPVVKAQPKPVQLPFVPIAIGVGTVISLALLILVAVQLLRKSSAAQKKNPMLPNGQQAWSPWQQGYTGVYNQPTGMYPGAGGYQQTGGFNSPFGPPPGNTGAMNVPQQQFPQANGGFGPSNILQVPYNDPFAPTGSTGATKIQQAPEDDWLAPRN